MCKNVRFNRETQIQRSFKLINYEGRSILYNIDHHDLPSIAQVMERYFPLQNMQRQFRSSNFSNQQQIASLQSS